MEHIKSYHLIKEKGTYILVIQLTKMDTEFANEFGVVEESKKERFQDEIRAHINKKFPHIKIPFCKVMIGSKLIGIIPIVKNTAKKDENIYEKSSQVRNFFSTYGKEGTDGQTILYKDYQVQLGEKISQIAIEWGIPQSELMIVNNLSEDDVLREGQIIRIPVHNIPMKSMPDSFNGECLDWWTEVQYIFSINKTGKVTDYGTRKTFTVKRTMGINHADCEPITYADTEIAKSVWASNLWIPRPIIIEVEGRKIAASMTFMPHGDATIYNNAFDGHFDIHFLNSTRHVDGSIDYEHQEAVKVAAGIAKY